jgi:peptidoglycan/xylan/chitin deacetylase (PgdA/CDA1 family)
MGVKVQYHPDILKRMIAEGHEIGQWPFTVSKQLDHSGHHAGNHAWNHPVLSKLPLDRVHSQRNIPTLLLANGLVT